MAGHDPLRFTYNWVIEPGTVLSVYAEPTMPVCGIYVLRFADGQAYVGQTVNLFSRFAAHRRRWTDIVALEFAPVPPENLNERERAVITSLERDGVQLRNIDLAGMPMGPSALDLVVDHPVQVEWLKGVSAELELGDRAESALRRRESRERYERLRSMPSYPTIADTLADYVARVIPWPHETERRFWTVSTLPSTRRSSDHHRLVTLNVGRVEALVLSETLSSHGDWRADGFLNVMRDTRLPRPLPVRVLAHSYRTTGEVKGLYLHDFDDVTAFLDDPEVLEGARKFAMALLRKGRGMFGRFHDFNLADDIFIAMSRLSPGDVGRQTGAPEVDRAEAAR